MKELVIKRIEWEDKREFEEMAIKYFQELDERFIPSQEWRDSYVHAVMQHEGSFAWWAIHNGIKAGFVVFRVFPHRYKPIQIGFIEEFYIAPELRRRGLGKDLAKQAISFMRTLGATRFELAVLDYNEAAKRFWATIGFRKSSENYRLEP